MALETVGGARAGNDLRDAGRACAADADADVLCAAPLRSDDGRGAGADRRARSRAPIARPRRRASPPGSARPIPRRAGPARRRRRAAIRFVAHVARRDRSSRRSTRRSSARPRRASCTRSPPSRPKPMPRPSRLVLDQDAAERRRATPTRSDAAAPIRKGVAIGAPVRAARRGARGRAARACRSRATRAWAR